MKLLRLLSRLESWTILSAGFSADVRVKGIAEDSRKVRKGDLFFCLQGAHVDGARFALDAVKKGAVGLVTEGTPLPISAGVLQVVVPDAREALAKTAHFFYGDPSRHLRIIGVTGTKGKTTTTYLIRSILQATGSQVGLIGTIAYEIGRKRFGAPNTTPSALEIVRLLHEMRRSGCRWAVMEVSSHALEMKRVLGMQFMAVLFTNLSHEHMDYHKTFGRYYAAKKRLFTEFPTVKARVVNADDRWGRRLLKEMNGRAVSYGLGNTAKYRASSVEKTKRGFSFCVQGKQLEVPLAGRFNIQNALAAAAVTREIGISWRNVQKGLRNAPAVPGRFETVKGAQGFTVLVDYAHTPDALEQALKAAREMVDKKVGGKLISLFGCGGDRDRTKRPIMGRLSARLADLTLLTSDNPRSETPGNILKEILKGLPASLRNGTGRVKTIENRAKAIQTAIRSARKGDVVLLAGKGHENYQILKSKRVHFDDREEARKALRARMTA